MALNTVITEIVDLIVLILDLGGVMLMAVVASIGIVIIVVVAKHALAVGVAMVQRETVVEAGGLPGIRTVTLRALPIEVVGRFIP